MTVTYTYERKFGSQGSGDGQFLNPHDISFDGSGNLFICDRDRNDVQKFTNAGVFISKFGSSGSGNGQFDVPYAIQHTPDYAFIYVCDRENNRVQKLGPTGTWISNITTVNSIALNKPEDITFDKTNGDMYITDTGNNRIVKLDSAHVFIRQWGSLGNGNGQFDHPHSINTDSARNVFISCGNQPYIQKFTKDGVFIKKFGTEGTGNGQTQMFLEHMDIDIFGRVHLINNDSRPIINVWDTNGVWLTKYGKTTSGSSNGQFKEPEHVTCDPSTGKPFVVDCKNFRIQVFSSNDGTPTPAPPPGTTSNIPPTDLGLFLTGGAGTDGTPAVYDAFSATYDLTTIDQLSPNTLWKMHYHGSNPVSSPDVGQGGVRVPGSPTGGFARVLYAYPYSGTNTTPPSNPGYETSASLIMSYPTYYGDFDITFSIRTVSQKRSSPNAWETAWFMFRFNEAEGTNFHHYYVAFKSNGHIEVGRKDNSTHAEHQYYLDDKTFSYTVNVWNLVRIRAVGNHIQVWIDGVLKTDIVDNGSVGTPATDTAMGPTPHPPSSFMYSGKFGLYCEDSEVEMSAPTLTLSGPNIDPNLSLGGNVSSTEITSDNLNNLFRRITESEAGSGVTLYRCVVIKNKSATQNMINAVFYMVYDTTSVDDLALYSKAQSAKNVVETAVVNEFTAPTGSNINFIAALRRSSGLVLGDLAPGEFINVWLRVSVNPGAKQFTENKFKMRLEVNGSGTSGGGGGSGGGGPVPPPDPDTGVEFRMAASSDTGTGGNPSGILTKMKNRNTDMIIYNGDLAYASSMSGWLTMTSSVRSKSMVSFGNHDVGDGDGSQSTINALLSAYGISKTYYSKIFHNVGIVVMEAGENESVSSSSSSAQYTFVKNALQGFKANPAIEWIFVCNHYPIEGPRNAHHPNEDTVRDDYVPLFDANGVDVVITGHNHALWRSKLLKYNAGSPNNPTVVADGPNFSYSKATANHGHVYFDVGGGGKSHYDMGSAPSYVPFMNNTKYGYLSMNFSNNGKTITFKFYDSSDNLLDTCSIQHT